MAPSGAQRRIAVFALTEDGAGIAGRVATVLGGSLWLPRSLAVAGGAGTHRFGRLGPALRSAFRRSDALVCVMATGVVVRSLAPVLQGKRQDPAVLCLDERGLFVIPLLSGHVGGANELARSLADMLSAQAVLTTSSDVQGLAGPDVLADLLDAEVGDPAALLPVSAALVNHRPVDLWFDPGEMGGAEAFLRELLGYQPRVFRAGELPVPASVWAAEGGATRAVFVTARLTPAEAGEELAAPLHLVPRWTVAGVGCKRGTARAAITGAVRTALARADLDPRALRSMASVEAKHDESGLAGAAAELGLPLAFAPDEEVERVMALHGLAENAFVRENVGVGAAAEPAALWASGEGATLVLPKQAADGVTVALARADGGRMLRTGETRWGR